MKAIEVFIKRCYFRGFCEFCDRPDWVSGVTFKVCEWWQKTDLVWAEGQLVVKI